MQDSTSYVEASSSFGADNFIANFRASRNFGESQAAGAGKRREINLDAPIGMNSMSQISQSVIQNKDSRLGFIQQSIKSSEGGFLAASEEGSHIPEEPARDVRSIIAKYSGQYQLDHGTETGNFGNRNQDKLAATNWLDEIEKIETKDFQNSKLNGKFEQ